MVCVIVLKRYIINIFTEPLNHSGLYLNIGTLTVFFFVSGTFLVKKKIWNKVKYSGFDHEKIFNHNVETDMKKDIWSKKECFFLSNTCVGLLTKGYSESSSGIWLLRDARNIFGDVKKRMVKLQTLLSCFTQSGVWWSASTVISFSFEISDCLNCR